MLNALRHKTSFIHFVKARVERNRLPLFTCGPQLFAHAFTVMGNDAIGGIKNGGTGAVILFQPHNFCTTKVITKRANVFNSSTTPAIDGLIVIPHDGHGDGFAGKHLQPGVLNPVGVLKFIHQQMTKP